jgi:hypothetical protein
MSQSSYSLIDRGDTREALLRLGPQCRLRETIEQLDRSAGDTEDLPAPASERDPGFQRCDTLRVQPLDQRLWQFVWQCMRHVGQCSQIAAFAKRKLTLISQQLLIQRWSSQN